MLEHRADAAAELLGLVGCIGLLGDDPVDHAAAVEVDRPHLLGPRHLGGVVDRIVTEKPDAADEPEEFCRRVGAVLEHELAALLDAGPGTAADRARRYL